MDLFNRPPSKPWGLKWRSSVSFITAVIGLGITLDLLVSSIIIPVIPFQLEHLNYHSVSALTGWLISAYSAGLVFSTIPIAIYAEKSSSRRTPLIIGLFSLLAAQVLLMEAPNYALMAIARVLQGISSSMVWVVGLALICDTTPEQNIGRQIGLATTGLSIGLMAGPPAGGALYARFGFRAPFILGEICTLVNLLLLLLLIERNVAIKWGYDPALPQDAKVVADLEAPSLDSKGPSQSVAPVHPSPDQTAASVDAKPSTMTLNSRTPADNDPTAAEISLARKPLPMLSVMRLLGKSSRAVVALTVAFIYGTVDSMLEPSLPLHLQAVWGYTSDQVGLVYLATLVPAVISSPFAGLLADRIGSQYIACICLLLSLPWWIVLVLRKSIALFIVALALQSFFFSGVSPPVNAELAAVSRRTPGVGYAHVYGAFNLVFGIGSTVGPIIGGQVYGSMKYGWAALCYITVALLAICIVPVFCFTGDEPVLSRVLRRQNGSQTSLDANLIEQQPKERASDDSAVPSGSS